MHDKLAGEAATALASPEAVADSCPVSVFLSLLKDFLL